MNLQKIAGKLLSFLSAKKLAIPPPIPSSSPALNETRPAVEPPLRKMQFGEGYLPVVDSFIERSFAADFRSAKRQGDKLRLSALNTLQRNALRHATSGDTLVNLSQKRFTLVVRECIQQSREVAQIFRDTGDEDLALNEEKETAVLKAYLVLLNAQPEQVAQAPTCEPKITTQAPASPGSPQAQTPRYPSKKSQSPRPPQPSPRIDATSSAAEARTQLLRCARCQTSGRNWLLRHDADSRPFPNGPNFPSKKTGNMIVLCPNCLSAARAAERFASEPSAKPQTQAPPVPSFRGATYDGRYAPAPARSFRWHGPGYCQHCNRRAMPGGDVCYSCNPD